MGEERDASGDFSAERRDDDELLPELFDVEIEFEAADELEEPEAENLIAELAETGATARILERHENVGVLPLVVIVGLVGVAVTPVAGLSVIVVFIYRTFRCGVIIDLTRKPPRISKNKDMPRGSLLIIYADGRQEYREGISDSDVAGALRDLLALGDAGG